MLSDLLVHPTTLLLLQALAHDPPQAFLLVGSHGIGKQTLATTWASQLSTPGLVQHVVPDEKGSMSIQTIRDLYRFTRSKQDGQQIVILHNADSMSLEAQNAFLKLLEEPRAGLTFVITTANAEILLPTIKSRLQEIPVLPLPQAQLRQYILQKQPGIAQAELQQLLFIAQGRPGITHQLITDKQLLIKERERMQLAKTLLVVKPYERLLKITDITADRENCLRILEAMLHMSSLQLKKANDPAHATHWLQLQQALQTCLQQIAHNGNIRAQLLRLFVNY